mmetsp:Transcript_14084/g.42592  ORF Transcript_14084/g.42592 Transcript_14084/m.42592 type:complete len:348 (-) Transcript_14084:1225-2268(-)|eukprot:CAMPEP_0198646476 /NCGR_PEP_ID=MMETSP1467-20131203/1935_1 /TAXON_ID=1462469 /ORGANISM="unid. sp., Strain CCMP2135" /LENGTH=347 /DNA_ID=CAMNT_0044382023 /DNA_START=57 /DNA_END=1100 /DNA_ORIENTATION=+
MFGALWSGSELLLNKIGQVVAPVQSSTQELFIAIRQRDWPRTQELLASPEVDCWDGNGLHDVTALHIACAVDFIECVTFLLSLGVDVNIRDRRNLDTPLHHGARSGHMRICQLLIEWDACPMVRNAQNQTAYDVTCNLSLRQWLLPLQLQAEAKSNAETGATPPHGKFTTSSLGSDSEKVFLVADGAHVPAQNFMHEPTSNQLFQPFLQSKHDSQRCKSATPLENQGTQEAQPHMKHTSVMITTTPRQHHYPPTPQLSAQMPEAEREVHAEYSHVSKRRDAFGRYADGFHSSSSDPTLAAKYGHQSRKSYAQLPPPPRAANSHDTLDPSAVVDVRRYIAYTPSETLR